VVAERVGAVGRYPGVRLARTAGVRFGSRNVRPAGSLADDADPTVDPMGRPCPLIEKEGMS
jgi:hypothetical protein